MSITQKELRSAFQNYMEMVEANEVPKIKVKKELLAKWAENRRRFSVGLPRITTNGGNKSVSKHPS